MYRLEKTFLIYEICNIRAQWWLNIKQNLLRYLHICHMQMCLGALEDNYIYCKIKKFKKQ